MATSKRASEKKTPAPKPAAKAVEPEVVEDLPEAAVEAAVEAIEPDASAAQAESEARRAVAQRLVDEGKAIFGGGQDEDGRHYFIIQQDEEPNEVRIYVDEEQS